MPRSPQSRSNWPGRSRAGASARREGRRRRRQLTTQTALPVVVLAAAGALLIWQEQVLLGLACLAGALLVTQGLRRRMARTRSWDVGATGEAVTARWLWPLRLLGFAVLHDLAIPGSRANIDHLVIGYSGAWCIDSKRWRGPVRIRRGVLHNGTYANERTPSTARWEADRASHFLGDTPVRPVLAIQTRQGLPLRRRLEGVWITSPPGVLLLVLLRWPSLGPVRVRALQRQAKERMGAA